MPLAVFELGPQLQIQSPRRPRRLELTPQARTIRDDAVRKRFCHVGPGDSRFEHRLFALGVLDPGGDDWALGRPDPALNRNTFARIELDVRPQECPSCRESRLHPRAEARFARTLVDAGLVPASCRKEPGRRFRAPPTTPPRARSGRLGSRSFREPAPRRAPTCYHGGPESFPPRQPTRRLHERGPARPAPSPLRALAR